MIGVVVFSLLGVSAFAQDYAMRFGNVFSSQLEDHGGSIEAQNLQNTLAKSFAPGYGKYQPYQYAAQPSLPYGYDDYAMRFGNVKNSQLEDHGGSIEAQNLQNTLAKSYAPVQGKYLMNYGYGAGPSIDYAMRFGNVKSSQLEDHGGSIEAHNLMNTLAKSFAPGQVPYRHPYYAPGQYLPYHPVHYAPQQYRPAPAAYPPQPAPYKQEPLPEPTQPEAYKPEALSKPTQPEAYKPEALSKPTQPEAYKPEALSKPTLPEPYKPEALSKPTHPEPYKPEALSKPTLPEPYKPEALSKPTLPEPYKPEALSKPTLPEPYKPEALSKPTLAEPYKPEALSKPTQPEAYKPEPQPGPTKPESYGPAPAAEAAPAKDYFFIPYYY